MGTQPLGIKTTFWLDHTTCIRKPRCFDVIQDVQVELAHAISEEGMHTGTLTFYVFNTLDGIGRSRPEWQFTRTGNDQVSVVVALHTWIKDTFLLPDEKLQLLLAVIQEQIYFDTEEYEGIFGLEHVSRAQNNPPWVLESPEGNVSIIQGKRRRFGKKDPKVTKATRINLHKVAFTPTGEKKQEIVLRAFWCPRIKRWWFPADLEQTTIVVFKAPPPPNPLDLYETPL